MATLIRVVRGVGRAVQKAHREQERQAKRVHAEQIRQEKAHQKQLIERGKSALAARVEMRKQLKDSMLNLKVNT